MASKLRILVDMDEVLVEFINGYLALWGLTRADVLPYWQNGEWSVLPALGKALGREEPVPWPEFWGKIDGNIDFWVNLEATPHFDKLMKTVVKYTDDWFVCTAPSWCDTSFTGKVRWLKKRFGREFDRFIPTPHKYVAAKEGVILIDDSDSNVFNFQEEGGIGIVFPKHHNSQHRYEKNPVEFTGGWLGYWASRGADIRKGTWLSGYLGARQGM